ncbi:MAG: GNAT family N-acetyltransferase [Anaerolineae bacterium]
MVSISHLAVSDGMRIELSVDGSVASSVIVVDRVVRIGNIPLRMGGIGDVSTRRAFRQKGYARQMLDDSVTYMREAGYHFSALFGIPNLYPKFGFVVAIPGTDSTIATRDAELAQARYPVRPFQPSDAKRVAEIYEQMNANRTFTCVRDPNTWTGFRIGAGWNDRIDALVILDSDKIIGYASYDLNPWSCAFGEVGYTTPTVYSTLLAEAAKQAAEKRLEKLTIHAPIDDPFIIYCRRYGCTTSLGYARNAHGMARIINQAATLQAIQPLLFERLQASQEAWRGTLVFATELGTDAVELGAGPELVLRLPQTILTQWVLGYRGIQDSLFETDTQVPVQAVPVLQAIFPTGYPYIYASDRF